MDVQVRQPPLTREHSGGSTKWWSIFGIWTSKADLLQPSISQTVWILCRNTLKRSLALVGVVSRDPHTECTFLSLIFLLVLQWLPVELWRWVSFKPLFYSPWVVRHACGLMAYSVCFSSHWDWWYWGSNIPIGVNNKCIEKSTVARLRVHLVDYVATSMDNVGALRDCKCFDTQSANKSEEWKNTSTVQDLQCVELFAGVGAVASGFRG